MSIRDQVQVTSVYSNVVTPEALLPLKGKPIGSLVYNDSIVQTLYHQIMTSEMECNGRDLVHGGVWYLFNG